MKVFNTYKEAADYLLASGYHETGGDQGDSDWENAESEVLTRIGDEWVIYTQGLTKLGRTVMAFHSKDLSRPPSEWKRAGSLNYEVLIIPSPPIRQDTPLGSSVPAFQLPWLAGVLGLAPPW